MLMVKELTSNLVSGKIPAGKTCFFDAYCKEKTVVCNGQDCPVTNNKVIEHEVSCGLARMVEVMCNSTK